MYVRRTSRERKYPGTFKIVSDLRNTLVRHDESNRVARLAARRMVANKSGVIMTISALPARTGTPFVGGYSPAMAARREVFNLKAAAVMTWEQWQAAQASRTHTRRLTTLEELANVAVFVASDKASGMTGTVVNLTMGSLDD